MNSLAFHLTYFFIATRRFDSSSAAAFVAESGDQ